MSSCWLRRDARVFKGDWNMLDFVPGDSVVFNMARSFDGNVLDSSTYLLDSGEATTDWIQEDLPINKRNDSASSLILLMASKGDHLSQLPFYQESFERLQAKHMIHSSIFRAINRGSNCSFINFSYEWDDLAASLQKSIIYNCRTSQDWPGDMALTVTFVPATLMTKATWFGCDLSKCDVYDRQLTDSELISQRLSNFDGRIFHPMVLPLMLADMERARQVDLVRGISSKLPQKLSELDCGETASLDNLNSLDHRLKSIEGSPEQKDISSSGLPGLSTLRRIVSLLGRSQRASSNESSKTFEATEKLSTVDGNSQQSHETSETLPNIPNTLNEPAISIWQEVAHTRDGLSAWRAQLLKMAQHVESIHEPTQFGSQWQMKISQVRAWKETSSRIQDRLKELLDEYDAHIRGCTAIMEGLALANQMELSSIGRKDAQTNQQLSRVSLEVARMARQDGSLMKSIAMLGMVFLPATFASAFFSMDFIDWKDESNGGKMPQMLWVFIGAAVGLTFITCGIFYGCVLRQRRKSMLDIEKLLSQT